MLGRRSIHGTADEGQATRYEALAQRLAQGIHDGALPIGDRLPSIRQLCQGQGVSPATATHALRMLEDAGLVEARPREGYFVRSRAHRPASPRDGAGLRPQPLALSDKRMLMLQFTQSGATDPLGVLTIDPHSLPIRQVQKIMIELARHQPELLIDWGSYKGDLRLRQRIAQRALEWGGSFSADDVIITHGNVEADTMCLRAVTRPGDTVAVPGPSHFCLLEQLDALQLKVVEIPTDAHHGMSVDALAAVLERQTLAACLLASFRDPMGSLMPEAEKLRLVQLLARHGVPLIEDDSDGELYHGRVRPRPCKAFDTTGDVLYHGDLSSLFAPNLRIGFVVAQRHLHQIERLRMAGCESPSPLLQQVAARFCEGARFDAHLRALRPRLRERTRDLREMVLASFPAGTRVALPQGGHSLWIEMPEGADAIALLRRAVEEGIHFAPGGFFGVDNRFGHCLRLNAGHDLSPRTRAAVQRLGALAADQKNL